MLQETSRNVLEYHILHGSQNREEGIVPLRAELWRWTTIAKIRYAKRVIWYGPIGWAPGRLTGIMSMEVRKEVYR